MVSPAIAIATPVCSRIASCGGRYALLPWSARRVLDGTGSAHRCRPLAPRGHDPRTWRLAKHSGGATSTVRRRPACWRWRRPRSRGARRRSSSSPTTSRGLRFAMYRLWTGVAVYAVVLLLTRRRLTWATFRACAPGGLIFGVDISLAFAAFKLTNVADATIIGAFSPVVIALVSTRIFGEQSGAASGCSPRSRSSVWPSWRSARRARLRGACSAISRPSAASRRGRAIGSSRAMRGTRRPRSNTWPR